MTTTAEPAAAGSCLDMLAACFRHQHPDAYGRALVEEAQIPANLRYGADESPASAPAIPEETMGDLDAYPIRVEDDVA